MKDNITAQLRKTKEAGRSLSLLDESAKNKVLIALAQQLRESVAAIIKANQKDLALMDTEDPQYDRLLLTESRIDAIANDLQAVANLSHPRLQVLDEKVLPNGLQLQKVRIPLGVVAIIYESRPNVTIDTFALCFKSGNACVLKGGKEAAHSNDILVALIQRVLNDFHLNSNLVYLLPADREALRTLLQAHGLVDVCIPRGSQALIDYVREHARIPFIETGAGIVHVYWDKSADLSKGILIVDNAKTRRVSVCNALDCLVIHQSCLADLPLITKALAEKQVALYADALSYKVLATTYPKALLHPAKPEDFGCEFLAYKMAIKTVASLEEAVAHIMHYSSGHSEAIIAEDLQAIDYFLEHVDAAALYANASTAFTDGAQFGLGAEIGISTQKLHARGPMALDALTSYKWIVHGNGQIRP